MRRARRSPVEVRDNIAPSATQQSLPFIEQAELPAKSLAAVPKSVERLWFCVWLPQLPLEAVADGSVRAGNDEHRFTERRVDSSFPAHTEHLAAAVPLAVVEEQHGVHRVLLTDAAAANAGVTVGQSVNAALALVPELRTEERSEVREQQVLEALATWLERFSSFVSIAGKDVLLLEIAGSLRLFGGLRELRKRISRGLREQGFTAAMAIAPTPLAATWLARSGRRTCIRAEENLGTALRQLPLHCLDWPQGVRESLTGMGIGQVGDCLRLPREGFTRRFGAERLLELDRALGHLPDPRDSWRAPERFCQDYEMTEEQSDREQLLNICNELLLSHEQFLLARQLGTQRLSVSFFHLRGAATELQLGSAIADRSAKRWSDLLGLRFEQLRLPEPVIAVRLRSGLSQPLTAETARLAFDNRQGHEAASGHYSITQLAERLVARIGGHAVNAVTTVAEHRPEYAWSTQSPLADWAGSVSFAAEAVRRPLWMLPEPALLTVDGNYPLHKGCRLRLLDGPERLETGWWDDQGISRDYYTAVNGAGTHLWVFRNRRKTPDWYLHGIFG